METQGIDPDYSKRALYDVIEKGGSLKWTMKIQVGRYSRAQLIW
jgi:catalase